MVETENKMPNFKIVMIGESGTGKTCIVARYDKDTFTPDAYKPTTGAAQTSKIEIV